MRQIYPGKKVFLLGHSFGSFIAQGFMERFNNVIDGCILCGTAGPQRLLVGFGKLVTSIVKHFAGDNSHVKFLESISFAGYNRKIKNPQSKVDWLSANEMNISMYQMDNWCGIPLTTSFYYDMTHGLSVIHKRKNMMKVPDIPMFLIYGAEDPVGSYGKTVIKLNDFYAIKRGVEDIHIKAYEGCRHEILNEKISDQVEKDIIEWMDEHAK